MNQTLANEKIKTWASLLLLDAPPGIQLGIDNSFWKIGEKFKGIKLIPPGPHYVYYSLGDEGNMFKTGFFLDLKEKEVVVRKWDKKA